MSMSRGVYIDSIVDTAAAITMVMIKEVDTAIIMGRDRGV
jgi:hypothetical protein